NVATLTLPRWFARTPSASSPPDGQRAKPVDGQRAKPVDGQRAKPVAERSSRSRLRVGIPRVLNLWSTHQFWVALFDELGIEGRRLVFSSDTSEEQGRQFGKGRGTVDCCYPVKCISGH